jgi:GntR family transcriptional regulator
MQPDLDRSGASRMGPRGKFSIEPLYLQVRNLLAQRIASGVWPPGSMLPNELELARELGVSSGTVRKALDSLESDRLVLRRQGRGTSVVDQASGEVATRFSNIRDGEGRRILGDLQLMAQTRAQPTPVEQERLQLNVGDSVLRTTRRRRYKGRLFMHEEVSLAVDRFPGLDDAAAGSFLISALAQRHGVHLAKASERVTLEEATPQTAKQLDVAPRSHLLRLDRVVYAAAGYPVEWRLALCSLSDDMLYFAEMV